MNKSSAAALLPNRLTTMLERIAEARAKTFRHEKRRWKYTRYHIASGHTEINQTATMSYLEFLTLLNVWNGQGAHYLRATEKPLFIYWGNETSAE